GVHVRGPDRGAIAAEIRETHVVEQNDDDVRALRLVSHGLSGAGWLLFEPRCTSMPGLAGPPPGTDTFLPTASPEGGRQSTGVHGAQLLHPDREHILDLERRRELVGHADAQHRVVPALAQPLELHVVLP